eukprot:jgi/Astpho2/9240/Aster-07195
MLLLVTAINDGIKGHATRVLIADSELAAHATLKIYVADVPDEVYINAALTMFPDKAESVPLKFARNAAYLLPLLGRKPHVLVLNHPAGEVSALEIWESSPLVFPCAESSFTTLTFYMTYLHADTWNIYHPGFLDHPSTQLMTLISINAMSRGLNLSNLVGSPQFGFHWHQGSPELQEPFNETKLQHEKMQLLTGTFGLRGNGDTATDPLRPQRLYLMEQCLAAGPNCSFVEWKYDGDGGDNHQAINRATRESWCVLQEGVSPKSLSMPSPAARLLLVNIAKAVTPPSCTSFMHLRRYNLQPTGDFVTRISFFQVTRRERIAAAGLAAVGALHLTLSGPSLAFVGNTPQDLRENTARATPNIELGKDAAKAVDRNKPALPSPGQVQDKVKDASRKIKNELSAGNLPGPEDVPSKNSLAQARSAKNEKAGGVAGGSFSVTSGTSMLPSSHAHFDLALGELKPLKESAKKPGLFDIIKQKALTKESPSVQLNKKGGTPTPAPSSK